MECKIYDINLNRVGIVSTWVSMVWEESYNGDGKFQLEMQYSDGLAGLFQPDRYCGIDESDILMVIKSVQIADGKITVGGYPVSYVLDERVHTGTVTNQAAETALRDMVSTMEPWPCLELGESAGLSDMFTAEKSDSSVLDFCQVIGEAVDMGYRLRHDRKQKKLLFECYKPEKNENARFSTLYGNLIDPSYSVSTAKYKNVAVVIGEGEGDARVVVTAGNTAATGADRREMVVDARSEMKEEGESDADYRSRLVRYGEEKLIEQVKIENFKFDIDPSTVKLGNIVSCNVPEFGVKLEVRITGITRKSQKNKTEVTATVGTPIVTRRR